MSMYQYLEREQEREQEAGWESIDESIDYAAEIAAAKAEQAEHTLYILQRWICGELKEIGTPLPRSTWGAI